MKPNIEADLFMPGLFIVLVLLVLSLGGCSYNSSVPTSETWTPVSVQQAAQFQERIDPYRQVNGRRPEMRNGCATSAYMDGDILVIPDQHPQEVYCVGVAPFQMTTIEFPLGSQLRSARTGMADFLDMQIAEGDRSVLVMRSLCLPLRKDEAGAPIQPAIYEVVEPSALGTCPRNSADLVAVTTTSTISFRVLFNESSRTRLVDVREDPTHGRKLPVATIPVRTPAAQELHATSVDGAVVPWVPDEAWADGLQTVVVWYRPMPTLPSLHVGQAGEQNQVALVINTSTSIAMVYPARLTEFELRMDSRRLRFSGKRT